MNTFSIVSLVIVSILIVVVLCFIVRDLIKLIKVIKDKKKNDINIK